jgi:6-phosphofructokinase 1
MAAEKRIGVLTSGGDCAGLNAALRAVVCRAVEGYGWEVIGIREGTQGLLARPVEAEPLSLADFDGSILRRGGTILGTTNKGNPFAYPAPDGTKRDRSAEVIEGYRLLGLDALIGIGGDGSLAILKRLADQGGLKLVAIPKTIDNDLSRTEVSIGYPTAVDTATQALDHLQPTAASHSRVMVLEVMGRDAGHIALAAGIAGGADIILIPEIPYSMAALAAKIEQLKAGGRNFALVIVAEAVRNEALQRGGMPVPRDRLMASIFGVHAVDLIAADRFNRMVGWSGRQVIDVPIEEGIAAYQAVVVDGPLVHTARGLGICFGDE